jgi:FAD/FMN-containing dehydrogenase
MRGKSLSTASSTIGGIVIDLSRYMSKVKVIQLMSPDGVHHAVRVGGGANWADVEREVSPLGMAAVGSMDGEVGLAGLPR